MIFAIRIFGYVFQISFARRLRVPIERLENLNSESVSHSVS